MGRTRDAELLQSAGGRGEHGQARDAHLVCGERARLVAADDSRAPQLLHRGQAAHSQIRIRGVSTVVCRPDMARTLNVPQWLWPSFLPAINCIPATNQGCLLLC